MNLLSLRPRFRSPLVLVSMIASLTLAAQPAAAAIMLLTRTSVISAVSGADASLVGETLTLRMIYDTKKVPIISASGPISYVQLISQMGLQPVLSLTYSFGLESGSLQSPTEDTGLAHLRVAGRADEHQIYFEPRAGTDGISMLLRGEMDRALVLDFDAPVFAHTIDTGHFQFVRDDGSTVRLTLGDSAKRDGVVRIHELNADPGAVPEPATWALMITGFGLAGGALRQRRLRALA